MPLTLNKEKVYECIQKYGAADPRVRGAVASRNGGSGSFIVLAGRKHIVFVLFGGKDGEREEVRVVETEELEEVSVKKKLFGSEIRLVMKDETKMALNIHNLAQNAWQSEVIELFTKMSEGLKKGLSIKDVFAEDKADSGTETEILEHGATGADIGVPSDAEASDDASDAPEKVPDDVSDAPEKATGDASETAE